MMNVLKLLSLSFCVIGTTACQSPSDGKNNNLNTRQTTADSVSTTKESKKAVVDDTSATIVSVDLGLAPKQYNARVLSQPNPRSIHPDWEQSKLGTSWSLFAKKKITNAHGVFYEGDLLSPRGGKMDKGPYFFIASEWEKP
ncbi:hypothetical protein FAZ15_02855 [Sphingobacterium olei]|uniref:Uncharacterized protein n=1 Tax=Sphingobacterium olei TaxID=2571155 RepID=A0A4U0P6Z8_9SPHI|nr:hypothetical protein [Sphingobacterium olei]TJZ63247.1 hypothetical protein FAZ15_02855 [Sphingobacterium olei]